MPSSRRRWILDYARTTALLLVPALIVTAIGIIVVERNHSKPAAKPAAATLPDGSRSVTPNHRLVGIYGAPNDPVLGVLGEQGPEASIARVRSLATQYQPLFPEKPLPTLEIITTVAAAEPTSNNDYSRETPVSQLWPWVNAARDANTYVILDLQPGSSTFVQQAKQYAELLKQPHVGLALDPEWRIQPGKKHLEDIGSVSIDEVNQTGAWLAQLTRDNNLPQKVFLLHQFRLSMLPNRERLQSHRELSTIVQMDGQGPQDKKAETYAAITANAPSSLLFGWKNFYAKDQPVLNPVQTMAVRPQPWYVSYQ